MSLDLDWSSFYTVTEVVILIGKIWPCTNWRGGNLSNLQEFAGEIKLGAGAGV